AILFVVATQPIAVVSPARHVFLYVKAPVEVSSEFLRDPVMLTPRYSFVSLVAMDVNVVWYAFGNGTPYVLCARTGSMATGLTNNTFAPALVAVRKKASISARYFSAHALEPR